MALDEIRAVKVPGDLSTVSASSKAWLSARSHEIYLYPQTTIRLNDALANELNANAMGKKAKLKALYNETHIAYLLQWKDDSHNIQEENKINSFADGFAAQMPTHKQDVNNLPYIGMGNSNQEVVVYLKKETNETKIFQRAFVAEGFGSLTRINEKIKYFMDLQYKNGTYKGVLVRPLYSEYENVKDTDIISFAIYDGQMRNRDGLKVLSSWQLVSLGQKTQHQVTITGDAYNGKYLVKEHCATCHRYADVEIAPRFMAPNLSNVGGYSIDTYLMQSLNDPDAVVVPGYNLNAHKNFEWYTLDENGKKKSIMPSFEWMDEKSKNDIVAYLKTLKSQIQMP